MVRLQQAGDKFIIRAWGDTGGTWAMQQNGAIPHNLLWGTGIGGPSTAASDAVRKRTLVPPPPGLLRSAWGEEYRADALRGHQDKRFFAYSQGAQHRCPCSPYGKQDNNMQIVNHLVKS